jgi:hypothetical protein
VGWVWCEWAGRGLCWRFVIICRWVGACCCEHRGWWLLDVVCEPDRDAAPVAGGWGCGELLKRQTGRAQ